MKELRDYLGYPIQVGQRAIRVHSFSHLKEFKKVTIAKIDITRGYEDYVGVITDGHEKIGWTYPERLIVETAFKDSI